MLDRDNSLKIANANHAQSGGGEMMPSVSLQPGDIVQCSPASHWAGTLVIVTEVRDWGIQGYAPVAPTGAAHVRLAWEHFDKVGRAIWTEVRNEPE